MDDARFIVSKVINPSNLPLSNLEYINPEMNETYQSQYADETFKMTWTILLLLFLTIVVMERFNLVKNQNEDRSSSVVLLGSRRLTLRLLAETQL